MQNFVPLSIMEKPALGICSCYSETCVVQAAALCTEIREILLSGAYTRTPKTQADICFVQSPTRSPQQERRSQKLANTLVVRFMAPFFV